MLGVSEAVVRQWIAIEWYGIEAESLSPDDRARAEGISRLSGDSIALVDMTIAHLSSLESPESSPTIRLAA